MKGYFLSDFQFAPPSLTNSEVAAYASQSKVGRRLKKRWIFLMIGLLFILAAPIILGIIYAQSVYSPAVPSGPEVEFAVEQGESTDEIIHRLQAEGLLDQPLFFKLYLRFSGESLSIQAGNFAIPQSISISDLAARLGIAEREQVVIQFVEGLRREEMAEVVQEHYEAGEISFSGQEFSNLALNPSPNLRAVLGSRLPADVSLQGYLFPDTYHIDRSAGAEDLIRRMLEAYVAKVTPTIVSGMEAEGFTEREGLILAALVEREAFADEERPVIAEILMKRLRTGEILGIDATLQYALGYSEAEETWWRRNITFEDLELDSPYNTRRRTGLPPAPIANPGLGAIQAVASPADTPYLYYLHDSTGAIHYASSLGEHNSNVARYIN